MKARFLVVAFLTMLFLLCIQAAHADPASDAYCRYDAEKAQAEKLLTQSPQLFIGGGRGSTATGNVLGVGITESLSKYLQGNLSHKISDADCQLYRATSEIQKHVANDITVLNLHTATARLKQVQLGIKSLDTLILDEQSHQVTGVSTLPNVAQLQAARASLVVNQDQLEQQIALTIEPTVSNESLRSLITLARTANIEEQNFIAHQQKLQNWDFSVAVGTGTNPNDPMFHTLPVTPFVTAQFTYSFAAPSRNRHLENAASAYGESLELSQTGPLHLASLLQSQVQKARDATKASLAAYEAYGATLQDQDRVAQGVDTAVARAFRIQLEVANINNGIELETAKDEVVYMTTYLDNNFPE